ncbi:MAG: hypothetical protein LBS93_07375 [Synergistaceae bacterium]|nr:hypothetical protein [Synergistaceae bacterium]
MISVKGNKSENKMDMKIGGRRRPAFSLLAVLVLAVIGMAFVSGVMYTFNTFSSASRAAVSRKMEYNVLQEGVERGKAFLRSEMVARDDAFRYKGGKVESLDDLLIRDESNNVMNVPLPNGGQISENGVKGNLSVLIYDMQYEPSDVKGTIEGIPPSTRLRTSPGVASGTPGEPDEAVGSSAATTGSASKTAGVYLVRAIFERDDGGGQKSQKTIETAVLQRTGAAN